MDHHPFVFRDKEAIHAKACGCGVVHLVAGGTTLSLSPEVALELERTLSQVLERQRAVERQKREFPGMESIESDRFDVPANVVRGKFPSSTGGASG